ERVDGPERAVLGVGREHLEPAVLHELTAEQHVARAQGMELDEVGDPFLGHLGLRFGSGTFILRELHYRHRRPRWVRSLSIRDEKRCMICHYARELDKLTGV